MNSYVVMYTKDGNPLVVEAYPEQDIIVDDGTSCIEIINMTRRSVETLPKTDATHSAKTYQTASSSAAGVTAWRYGSCLYEAVAADDRTAQQAMARFLTTFHQDNLDSITVIEKGDDGEIWVSHGEDFLQFTPWQTIRDLEVQCQAP